MKLETRAVNEKIFVNATKVLTEQVFSNTRTYAQSNKLICGTFEADKCFTEKLIGNTLSYFVEADTLKLYLATSRLVSNEMKLVFMKLLTELDIDDIDEELQETKISSVEDKKARKLEEIDKLETRIAELENYKDEFKERIYSLSNHISFFHDCIYSNNLEINELEQKIKELKGE